jgi:hypothetical protein
MWLGPFAIDKIRKRITEGLNLLVCWNLYKDIEVLIDDVYYVC